MTWGWFGYCFLANLQAQLTSDFLSWWLGAILDESSHSWLWRGELGQRRPCRAGVTVLIHWFSSAFSGHLSACSCHVYCKTGALNGTDAARTCHARGLQGAIDSIQSSNAQFCGPHQRITLRLDDHWSEGMSGCRGHGDSHWASVPTRSSDSKHLCLAEEPVARRLRRSPADESTAVQLPLDTSVA